MRVLIVDDSRMARLMLRNAVESLGHETLEACDGQQAWDMLVRNGADVVVSDWMMPGLEGPELCRRVRARQDGSYTYFILLTTLADRRFALEGMEAGADDYLPKPLDVGELQLRLIAAQRITQLHKELLERDTHLRYLAGTDPLTGLPNRALFLDHLEQAWPAPSAGATGRRDVPGPGQLQGRQRQPRATRSAISSWRQIAERLRECLREEDTAARLGGDEMAVLLEEVVDEEKRRRDRRADRGAHGRAVRAERSRRCSSSLEHRHRAEPPRPRPPGYAAARRGPGDVPGQGERQSAASQVFDPSMTTARWSGWSWRPTCATRSSAASCAWSTSRS